MSTSIRKKSPTVGAGAEPFLQVWGRRQTLCQLKGMERDTLKNVCGVTWGYHNRETFWLSIPTGSQIPIIGSLS